MIKIDEKSGKIGVLLESNAVKAIYDQELKGYPSFDEKMKLIESFTPVANGEKELLEIYIEGLDGLLSNPVTLEIFKLSLEEEDFKKLLSLIDTKKAKLKVKCSNPNCDFIGTLNMDEEITELDQSTIDIDNECPQCKSELLCSEEDGWLVKNEAGYLVKVGEVQE